MALSGCTVVFVDGTTRPMRFLNPRVSGTISRPAANRTPGNTRLRTASQARSPLFGSRRPICWFARQYDEAIGLLARSAADLMLLIPNMADLPASRSIVLAVVLHDVVAQSEPEVRRACADVIAVRRSWAPAGGADCRASRLGSCSSRSGPACPGKE